MTTTRSWLAGLLLIGSACAACDPVDGKYTLESATVTVSNDRIFVDAVVKNDGSDDWTAERCIVVKWEAAPGVSREQARAGITESTVAVVELQEKCAGSGILGPGSSDSFQVISNHTREELAGTVIVTVPKYTMNSAYDTRIVQPSP